MKSETKKDQETSSPPTCKAPGCQELPLFDGHCAGHWAAERTVVFARQRFEEGDWLSAILGVAGMATAQAAQPMIQQLTQDLARAAQGQPFENPFPGAARWFTGGQSPPRPPPMNPWPILGLDPKTATSEDVKAMQRRLAELYHPDKGVKGVSDDALKVVNQAADLALKHLKQQGR